MKIKELIVIICLLLNSHSLRTQLILLESGIDYLINFDESLTGVNEGEFLGSGIVQDAQAGQLDSDAWIVIGCSDGDSEYGSNYAAGDFSRGESFGGETTGGIYSFTIDNNKALGWQSTSSDMSPGEIILKMQN